VNFCQFRCFIFGQFDERCIIRPNFWATSIEKVVLANLAKYGLGYILGDFFINASGHPGHGQTTLSRYRMYKRRRQRHCGSLASTVNLFKNFQNSPLSPCLTLSLKSVLDTVQEFRLCLHCLCEYVFVCVRGVGGWDLRENEERERTNLKKSLIFGGNPNQQGVNATLTNLGEIWRFFGETIGVSLENRCHDPIFA
jgi:hypothetical protein